ncbi:MAG TPA: TRZ/ATZ family hydrolase, partial [Casimicrobium sp.]|nr:TRZ/ATZ family hydrolase [Casimicrobium sp.]
MSLTLISARWLITATTHDSRVRTIEHASVLVAQDGRIVEVGSTAELKQRLDITEWIELPNHLLAPGLINAHCHSAMTLL